ncbi:hypothetical protein BVC80_9089g96 [Macleaya cordata]|uniref:Uncharacterized protein n=1 Tax=Macleaya cordata TaxID=56857 RepID=A0A200PQM6_MACCD|nr:hypothetical protein BVC80_9089g96 [Macleaya cordata]
MHRSASTSRASDEFLINLSPAVKGSPGIKVADIDKIPMYNPSISDATSKKDSSHLKSSGENVVHLIPIVLILCAFLLWVFSHPVADMTKKGGPIIQVEGLNIHGHGNLSHMPPGTKLKDLERVEQIRDGEVGRILVNKSG